MKGLIGKSSLRGSIFIFAIALGSPAWAGPQCSNVFSSVSVSHDRVQALIAPAKGYWDQAFAAMQEVSANVLAGNRMPNWNDFEAVKNISVKLAALRSALAPHSQEEWEALISELAQYQSKPSSVSDRTLDGTNYKPTEYDLLVAFRKAVSKVDREAPGLFKSGRDLAVDQRRVSLNKDGRALIQNLEKEFDKAISTTGYADYEAFEKMLRSSTDPNIQKAIQLLDRNQIRVAIRRPEAGRFWVPKTGFQNQFVTGSSRGSLSADLRNNAENQLYGFGDVTRYAALDPELKPKYATLVASRDSGVTSDISTSYQYGPDIYHLKNERFSDRLTFYPTDSLGPGRTAGTNWNNYFIPWSRRLLMVPFMISELQTNLFSGRTWPSSITGNPSAISYFIARYWEAQITGRLTLDDVEAFEFQGNPPAGEFLEELKTRNIKIYDGRTQPAKEWVP